MAEVAEQLPAKRSGRPKGSKYDPFLDGQVWKLTPGVDGHHNPQGLERALRHAAHTRGLFVAVRHCPDGFVYVQARPRD